MSTSFGKRCDELNDAIRSGSIGCPFAKVAAENNGIRYCPCPRFIDLARPSNVYIQAISEFARDETASVLIALPDKESPVTPSDCKAYAELLYPETVSSMEFATVRALIDISCDRDPKDRFDFSLLLTMSPDRTRRGTFKTWADSSHLLKGVPTDAKLFREKSMQPEEVFSFTMDPSYEPLDTCTHPRWSPHFALVMNYRSDLQGLLISAREKYVATKAWILDSVGYPYVQGYRIPQIPERKETPQKAAWRPRD